MPTNRKIVFRNELYYHVFNRSIERKTIFKTKRELSRAKELIKFYRHKDIPESYSKLLLQPKEIRQVILSKLYKSQKLIDVLCYCLMPNHFHLLVKQNTDNGIAKYISNFTNAYTRYFNIKYKRVGPLFEGVFKAVLVESEEQLIHLSRYIHINPVVSGIINKSQLETYPWSSYMEYLKLDNINIADKDMILGIFNSTEKHKEFVNNQIDYGEKLEAIKHLTLE